MKSKLSKVSFFLYLYIYNYIWLRILFFNFFYNNYGSMAVLFSFILTFMLTLLLWLIPKKILKKDFVNCYKKSKTKYLNNCILALESMLGIAACSYILSNVFIMRSSPILIIIGFAIVIGILSHMKSSDVVQISTLFTIMGVFFLIFSFSYFTSTDISFLLPMQNQNWIMIPVFLILVLSDNFTLLLMDKDSFTMTKPSFIIPIVIALLSFTFEIFMLQASSGTELFKDLSWVGFVCLSIQPVTKYLGNFDFAYIYLLVICCIFKYAFNWSIIRNSLKNNTKKMTIPVILLLALGSIVFYYVSPFGEATLWIASTLLIIGFFIFIWYIKETYHAKQA